MSSCWLRAAAAVGMAVALAAITHGGSVTAQTPQAEGRQYAPTTSPQAADAPRGYPRADPSVVLAQLREVDTAATHVVVGRVRGYEDAPGDPKQRPRQPSLVRFAIAVDQALRGETADEISLWIGGRVGDAGPVLVTDNPTPLPEVSGVAFLIAAPGRGPNDFIPAGDEWSWLPVIDRHSVLLPSRTTAPREAIQTFVKGGALP